MRVVGSADMDQLDVVTRQQIAVVSCGKRESGLLLRFRPARFGRGADPDEAGAGHRRIVKKRQGEVRMAMHLADKTVSDHSDPECLHNLYISPGYISWLTFPSY